MNVLVSNISSYKAIVISKYLKKHYKDIKIYSIDKIRSINIIKTKYTDKHIHVNPIASDYISTVKQIIKEYKIDIFIPVLSDEMELFIKQKHEFGKALSYFGSYESFKILNEKDCLHKLACSLNIKVPKLYKNFEEAALICVLKPKNLSSAKGVHYIFSQDDLDKAKSEFANRNDIILQEYIKGEGVGYSLFASRGKIIVGSGHRRLAEYPASGGSSVYRENYSNSQMVSITEKIIGAVNWSGFAMFEFKLTAQKELYLIEVNPRIWGSINQGLQNGINYFSALFGEPDKKVTISKGVIKTYLSPLVYLAFLKYLIRLKIKPLLIFIINILRNKPDVSIIDDSLGWISLIIRKIK